MGLTLVPNSPGRAIAIMREVAAVDGEEACAFILQWSDREWWPEAEPFEAGYLHKLCVRRKFAHRGMTAQVVEAVKAECARRGVRRLRLDTGA